MCVLTDCVICLWKFSGEGEKAGGTKTAFTSSGSGVANQESWTVTKILRYIVSIQSTVWRENFEGNKFRCFQRFHYNLEI